MQDNPILHALYTLGVLAVDNISTVMAVVLFSLQLIVLVPKVLNQIKKWRGKDGEN